MALENPITPYSYMADNKQYNAYIEVVNNEINGVVTELETLNAGYLLDKNGDLLDYLALGIYGITRPYIPLSSLTEDSGSWGQRRFLTRFLSFVAGAPPQSRKLTDNEFKKLIQWLLYKGDCELKDYRVVNLSILKQKIAMFLDASPYEISIIPTSNKNFLITLNKTNTLAVIFRALLINNYLQLPSYFTFQVSLK
jgi:hypothetical protein